MTNKNQNILILAITAFMIVLVIVWFTVLNKGTVAVKTGLADYSVTINNIAIPCEEDPCSIKSKIGTYGLIFNKEGYNSVSVKVEVARWKVTDVTLNPKKKVEITPSVVVPKTEEDIPVLPEDLNAENAMYPVWHADGSILFLDKSDERLKIRSADGKIRLVTVFKNITPPAIGFYWSGDGARVTGSQIGDLYFVDVEQGSRKKQILEFTPKNITWSPKSDFILVDDGADNVYKIDWDNREPVRLESGFRLDQSKWINDNTLLIYSMDTDNNKIKIWTLDPSSEVTETLVEKYDFQISEMVYDKEAVKAYLKNFTENAWYEINLL